QRPADLRELQKTIVAEQHALAASWRRALHQSQDLGIGRFTVRIGDAIEYERVVLHVSLGMCALAEGADRRVLTGLRRLAIEGILQELADPFAVERPGVGVLAGHGDRA